MASYCSAVMTCDLKCLEGSLIKKKKDFSASGHGKKKINFVQFLIRQPETTTEHYLAIRILMNCTLG